MSEAPRVGALGFRGNAQRNLIVQENLTTIMNENPPGVKKILLDLYVSERVKELTEG